MSASQRCRVVFDESFFVRLYYWRFKSYAFCSGIFDVLLFSDFLLLPTFLLLTFVFDSNRTTDGSPHMERRLSTSLDPIFDEVKRRVGNVVDCLIKSNNDLNESDRQRGRG